MTTASHVSVRIDDRARLMSSVLALTPTIDEAHARRPHSAHAHARATRKQLAALRLHPAVSALQALIEQRAPMEAIFGYALRLKLPEAQIEHPPRWSPPDWDRQLGDFYQQADLKGWWRHEAVAWDKCAAEARRMFAQIDVHSFLKPFIGSVPAHFVFAPNILYPTDHEIGVKVGDELTCIAPPRAAWGDSPPWPFDEDPVHIYRAAIGQYTRLLMRDYLAHHEDKLRAAAQIELPVSDAVREQNPEWKDQFLILFAVGAVAIFLEDRINAAEAKAFTLMESKVHGMAMLPGVVSVLRRYLNDSAEGKYESFADFLPLFPRQLRVAKRIYAL